MSTESERALLAGRYVAETHRRSHPDDVIDAARLCLADWVAVALGAEDEDAGRIVRETTGRWGSAGNATVIFAGTAAPAVAALANGTLAHCLDFDDTYIPAITHTSAPVWSTVLAIGEHHGADEWDMLRSFVAGFEVVARLGQGLGQELTARGLHSTGVFGRIGSAAAAAALLRLDASCAAHALATAATQASGLTASFGTMAKPFHAGKAAMDGVLAAELARSGFVAAPATLSPGGLDKALIQDGVRSFSPLDFTGWQILNNSFKPYAACHLVHPAVDAARALFAGGADIRRVRARVSPLAMQITGGASGHPATPLAAKFDLRYCIGLGLAGQPVSAADFAEPWRPLPAALEAARRVDVAADATMGFAAAALDVEFGDGRKETLRVEPAKGHPGNPMRWADMWPKFEALAAPVLAGEASKLFEIIRTFAAGGSLAGLTAMLRTAGKDPTSRRARAQAATAASG
jgi:2-methylcitrate dehydratase PrpD